MRALSCSDSSEDHALMFHTYEIPLASDLRDAMTVKDSTLIRHTVGLFGPVTDKSGNSRRGA